MPSPVVLKVEFAAAGPEIRPMVSGRSALDPTVRMQNPTTALVTWPVDVGFDGRRTFQATLDFGARPITTITLDPACRFPDRNPDDNAWPRSAAASCGG